MEYIAHIRRDTDGAKEPIKTHLTEVAKMTEQFAEPFAESLECAKEGHFEGMLHDIGKYGKGFQLRIRGKNIRVNHSTAGAKTAFFQYRDAVAAFCIAGHHGGIPDLGTRVDTAQDGTLFGKLNDTNIDDYSDWTKDQPNFDGSEALQRKFRLGKTAEIREYNIDTAFLIHMLFSCLVDADFLCTERFMSGGTVKRDGYDSFEVLLGRLNAYISQWDKPSSVLNSLRYDIQRQCIAAADRDERLFSLTVPTGGGKTISSLAFALNYATNRKHPKKRIVYVIPYTSIIDQNAKTFREILGDENVVEHHSNVREDDKEDSEELVEKRLLACENWDAPVIVTTAVQFFESLFSNKPGKSRKLHNLADSVIIFDEAQMLPVDFIEPCVCAINQLCVRYGAAAVLCTATQPNLDGFFAKFRKDSNFKIPEICAQGREEFDDNFRRAQFVYDGSLEDDELAFRLRAESSVLCIVNTKRHAEAVYALLGKAEGHYCLTTRKYPNHRRKEIEEIKKRLKEGLPCRVVSTSLIEAGVDIDFQTVYRAITGLDSILQAGGRCNRENKRALDASIVHIFKTEQVGRFQEKNIASALEVIRRYGENIYKSEAIRDYFNRLYYIKSGAEGKTAFDAKSIMELCAEFKFKTAAEKFQLIDNGTVTVYIDTEESHELLESLRKGQYDKRLLRKLQGYGVDLYSYELEKLDNASAIEITEGGFYVLADHYSKETGIVLPDEGLGQGIIR